MSASIKLRHESGLAAYGPESRRRGRIDLNGGCDQTQPRIEMARFVGSS